MARLQLSGDIALGGVTNYNLSGQVQSNLSGSSRINNASGTNSISGDVTFNATGGSYVNIISSAGLLTLDGNLTAASVTGDRTFHFAGAGNTMVNGVISNGSANVGVSKDQTGTLTLNGANTYTGNTTITAGTLQIGNGGTTGSLSTSSLITKNATLGFNRSNTITQGTDFAAVIAGTGNLVQAGSGTLVLSGTNTYTGSTTISAGTLEINSTGLLGGGSYSQNIVNGGALLIGSNSNQVLSGGISGTGSLTKNGSGTLTLSGNNSYSGGTTINTGTLVIGHANAAGSGTITQVDGNSLLKFDTTGTITNTMSVHNVLSTQSATLSGAITVNNATWDIDTGDTLNISGGISGNGGITKNGGGTLVLSGSNSYNSPTTVNAGTLNAANANALGSNNTVTVNDGTLLVSTDDAINGKQITLNGTSTTVATLAFSSNYTGSIGKLTLSANSIIDLGQGNIGLQFADMIMGFYNLSIYNWSGTTQWGTTYGTGTDQLYFNGNFTASNVKFYSGAVGSDSFIANGFDMGLQATSWDSGLTGHYIIPVPEPETWATGILLLFGGAVWLWRKRRQLHKEKSHQGI